MWSVPSLKRRLVPIWPPTSHLFSWLTSGTSSIGKAPRVAYTCERSDLPPPQPKRRVSATPSNDRSRANTSSVGANQGLGSLPPCSVETERLSRVFVFHWR